MTKTRTAFRCGECGAAAPRWVGRCPTCSAWNTLLEEPSGPSAGGGSPPDRRPLPIAEVDAEGSAAEPTGVGELDRVLGGGLVPGSVTLLGGEPGIGKSTLVLQLLASLAAGGRRCLLVTAEESAQQVRLRARRLGALAPGLWLVAETDLPAVLHHIEALQPFCLVLDSIQTVVDPEVASVAGSVAQVRQCAHRLVQAAKRGGVATVLVGHVTKDGTLAGPRALEHVVDTVLSFEGDRHHALRLLRAVKHRFGPTGELGLFEMAEDGLRGVPDAGGLFLSDRRAGVAGSAVVATAEGHRSLVVEVQALVVPTSLPAPRRSAQGLDTGRLAMLMAVLERRVGIKTGANDVYVSAVGGVRVAEPGADLGLALAVVSAAVGQPLPDDLVACAEVGLGGELRQVGQIGKRLTEASRLGFRRVLVPPSAPPPPPGLTAVPATTVREAVRLAGLDVGCAARI